ncbi:hypothetical protein N0V90_008515 [Kalmusia sp. IMI 367209]|nr:hypothetical protein N0V90_008515 [Kalmusia sp. IMI 367209]
MATDHAQEVYDLLLLVDATSSMSNYLESLRISFPKVISISKLTNSFARIGLLAYRDYSEASSYENPTLEWSGWYSYEDLGDVDSTTAHGLMHKAANLEAIGGGDFPEATKTGLARAYSLMREDATTIILLYTDAPPHCWMVADKDRYSNYYAEQAALKKAKSFGGYGPHFADWVEGCKQLHNGSRKAHVFCFLDEFLGKRAIQLGYYLYLSTITRGACLYLTDATPHSIAQVTVDVLLAWMGVEKAGVGTAALPATLVRYQAGGDIRKIKDEKDPIANSYFWAYDPTANNPAMQATKLHWYDKIQEQLEANQVAKPVDSEVLKKYFPKRKTKAADFAQRYLQDAQYKELVFEELKDIIETDVTSIALNAVFGSLWRAVCNDRSHPARNDIIAAFGASVEKIEDDDEKARMKNWLEESYDYAADILYDLEAVSQNQRFPCVYLDPTIEFRPAKEKHGESKEEQDEDDREITTFRRDELLDIGRSCDGHILRRLGRVLTRLTYAESAEELPAHVIATTNAEVPKVPVILASEAHGWKFWKILLHTVLPGTMLSTRPAMVLAALAMRIGLKPLFEPAKSAMLFWRDKWNNLEVPETWNVGCLGLLLDADDEYQKQTNGGEATAYKKPGLLLPSDRQLFSQLVAYKLAEANLHTTLAADVSWTPVKTQLPVGHLVTCNRCKHSRSVTIMAEKSGGLCGLCVASDWRDAGHKQRAIEANVTKTNLAWVECSVRTCRAQYVCYNVEDLNVHPKCHYCRRTQSLAPTLECIKCQSKVIWPKEWRAAASTPFNCVACVKGEKTVVAVDVTAEQICKENGQAWLLQNDKDTLKQPFKGSLFRTITAVGAEAFLANVRVLPTYDSEPMLTLRGKPIQNQASLKCNLEAWIRRRSAEKTPFRMLASFQRAVGEAAISASANVV